MNQSTDTVFDFVDRHKQGLSYLLNLKSGDVTATDIVLLCNQLAPEIKDPMVGGKVNPLFIDTLKQKQIRSKNQNLIEMALFAIDKASIFGKKVSTALNSGVKFSPALEEKLEERRKELSRKSFRNLADAYLEKKRHIAGLRDLLLSSESFDDPGFRFKVNAHIKMLKSDLKKCDFHARAGVNWALKSGVSLDNAYKGIDHIYLRHLKQADQSLAVVDQLLQSNGFKCNMGEIVKRSRARWVDDILEARKILSNQNHEVNSDATSEFGI